MKVGDQIEVAAQPFTVVQVLAMNRYVVRDANGDLDAIEGPDTEGRFRVLVPTSPLVEPTPANLPPSRLFIDNPNAEAVTELICAVLARGREPGAATDPAYFDLKAESFEAIAGDEEHIASECERLGRADNALWRRRRAGEARGHADRARARATELRAAAEVVYL